MANVCTGGEHEARATESSAVVTIDAAPAQPMVAVSKHWRLFLDAKGGEAMGESGRRDCRSGADNPDFNPEDPEPYTLGRY